MGDETSNDDGNWEIVPCAGGIRWRSQYFDTLRKRRRTISNKRISIFHLVFAEKKKKCPTPELSTVMEASVNFCFGQFHWNQNKK